MDPQLKHSLWAAALYFIVANPVVYNFMQSILGSLVTITDVNGTPTQLGTLIHALVFGLLTLLLMRVGAKRRAEGQ